MTDQRSADALASDCCLRSTPAYTGFRAEGDRFTCSDCGAGWVWADDEADGGGWARANGCLFQTGDFTLASGQKSSWKIECDALSEADWAGLAAIAATLLPSFGSVVGVPRGGLPFAQALEPYATRHDGPMLVADDVWTTGGSMYRFIGNYPGRWLGVVAFARNPIEKPNVTALFTAHSTDEVAR